MAMEKNDIIDALNDKQKKAVTIQPSNVLVLAGAGSGKTRVLVHRLAWLFTTEGVSPHHILAVTFTNKAANEMKARIEQLMQISTAGMWVGTFHGLCHRLLRIHSEQANLTPNFQVIDSDDQYRLIRRVVKALNLDEKNWSAKQIQWFINSQKDEMKPPGAVIDDDNDPRQQTLMNIYHAYEKSCQDNQMVDFSGLILKTYQLFNEQPDILAQYQSRFRHLLVDEFQDTNTIQYALLKLLKSSDNYIMAVGDDDQSIYGWRGAQVGNILRFERDFHDVATIRLEQNYRSTQTILSAANALIAHNQSRMGKSLWTSAMKGDPIRIYRAFNELDEAAYMVALIQQWRTEYSYNEFAVLYRSNAQSRVLEEALLKQKIPYRVYGGLRFFERAEIKTALAYLRLMANPNDNDAFERVVNTPTRGIGERTLLVLRAYAQEAEISLFEAAQAMTTLTHLTTRARNALAEFIVLMQSLRDKLVHLPLYQQVDVTLKQSGLIEHYKKEHSEKAISRLENLSELVTAARQFHLDDEAMQALSPLDAFVSYAALEAGEGQGDRFEQSVQLMSLHAAKGLEFPVVFISGLEEQLFPSPFSLNDASKLEEERRLCYVGMTRAKKQLVLTHCESRRIHGQTKYQYPSRFLGEIPQEHVQNVRMKAEVRRPQSATLSGRSRTMPHGHAAAKKRTSPWPIGLRIAHPSFGEGTVIHAEGEGDNIRLQIQFSSSCKWIMPAFAKLERLG